MCGLHPQRGWPPLRELGGALGDLGTFLPLVLGAIAVSGLAGAGVFTAFGVAYLLTAAVYRAPIPVQPMKVAAAVAITAGPTPGTMAGAALVLAVFFLVAGATGLIARLAQSVPAVVTAALQVGLGLSLAWIALGQLVATPGLGAALLALLVALLVLRPGWPAAIIVLAGGAAAGGLVGIDPGQPIPAPVPGWPPLHWPDTAELARGAFAIALPQIPLTLTNAVLVTAVVGAQYYPRARRLDATRLALTTGAMNGVAVPLAGIPICHGAGGVTAHYRFGARTAWAPAMLGLLLLALGLGWGDGATALLRAYRTRPWARCCSPPPSTSCARRGRCASTAPSACCSPAAPRSPSGRPASPSWPSPPWSWPCAAGTGRPRVAATRTATEPRMDTNEHEWRRGRVLVPGELRCERQNHR
ncbi:MAG: putative sulfate/molybdate transporter [Halofilum sp. (in: g-proteobacteria)]|nr:putative sulfate/molybdate transporter [Halofilum sp. (in: g-proteobacteria)]